MANVFNNGLMKKVTKGFLNFMIPDDETARKIGRSYLSIYNIQAQTSTTCAK